MQTAEAAEAAETKCESCKKELREDNVSMTMWSGDQLVVVEDIPAMICDNCMEQFYDEETQSKLRYLASNGFSKRDAVREITVPVFSLEGEVAESEERRVA